MASAGYSGTPLERKLGFKPGMTAAFLDAPDGLLADLHSLGRVLDLAVLVEAHDEGEVERAMACGARIVGVNSRSLQTFAEDLAVAERLAAIPEVLEVHTITGAGDMLCRVVARTNADLQRVIDAIVAAEGVVRASTVIALATTVPYRVLPLVRTAARPPAAPS